MLSGTLSYFSALTDTRRCLSCTIIICCKGKYVNYEKRLIRLPKILVRQHRLYKHLHLGQLKIVMAVENMGGAGEGGSIGKMQGADEAVKAF